MAVIVSIVVLAPPVIPHRAIAIGMSICLSRGPELGTAISSRFQSALPAFMPSFPCLGWTFRIGGVVKQLTGCSKLDGYRHDTPHWLNV